jgi:hypothetical protein
MFMATLSLTWHAMHDACPTCKALNGYIWTFKTGSDMFNNLLFHPSYGVVWDVQNGSKAHGHHGWNCRCRITAAFDLSDTLASAQKLLEDVKAAYQPPDAGAGE